MSLLSVELTGVQEPQILLEPIDVDSHVEAEEAIELAEAYGMTPDDHQKICLYSAMGTRADGRWAASQVGDCESRQNGKGDKIQIRELHGMVNRGEPIIHTAHEYPTAARAFQRLEPLFLNWDDLRRLVKKIRYANGEQGIELLNGGSIHYKARTGAGARGFDDIGTIVYDEAQHLQGEHLAASSPTGAVHPNPQTWFAGSAGLSSSLVWWQMRKRALIALARRAAGLPNLDPRFAYVEHTAEVVWLDDKGKFQSIRPDVHDRQTWAKANPAYNTRISDEFLLSQLGLLGEDLFLREHGGVWDPVPETADARPVKLPADKWADTGITAERALRDFPGKAVTVAFEVTKNGEWASVSTGAGSLQSPYVETIEHRKGVGWLPEFLVERVHRNDPIAVGCNGAGPAGAQVGAILLAFAEADPPIDPKILKQLGAGDYKQACGGFYTDVVEGRLKRPADGQGPLDLAAADATERPLSGGWAWDSRDSTIPLSPLSSATIARALLPVARPKQPPKRARAYSF